ncbi:MAG: TetR/AcrR family transcriptional regulator [Myxococcales bacterium]|nr:TetR/AcrR family transcriptional regulator [Myxococcales bacterium]MCB9716298.1 TetR/AcrR family transcriptional regulator [Myxococcales bacterium]
MLPSSSPPLDLDEPRTRRIVDVALRLAEDGGFAAVRLRDVAQEAGVALRTLYKRFPGKDELVFAVLVRELVRLELLFQRRPPAGRSAVARVRASFELITEFLCGRANLGRAIVRAVAGNASDLSRQVATFHDRLATLIVGAIVGRSAPIPTAPDHPHHRLAAVLQHVWFSMLVGWSNGLHSPAEIVDAVVDAAALVLDPPPRSA